MIDAHTSYRPTAYSSAKSARLPVSQWRGFTKRERLFSHHLSFGNYAGLDSATEISIQLEDNEHVIRDELLNSESYCNAQQWKFRNTSKLMHLLGLLKFLSFPAVWVLWGAGFLTKAALEFESSFLEDYLTVFALISGGLFSGSLVLGLTSGKVSHILQITGLTICTVILIYLKGTVWDTTDLHLAYWISASLYFMGAIGFDAFLILSARYYKHDGSEFNRMDGMVRFKRPLRRLFVAPFEEFDPVLRTLPLPYGGRDYTIVLYHRYTSASITLAVKMHTLGLDKVNALAFWDCLQRYMDVTQPLPDLPVLEPYRHLDPVTVEHDARTGRSPRRWRDQSLIGWKTGGGRRLRHQLQNYPWQQHDCVVRARLSETLTVWEYYKSLEARGVDISPKSADYLEPHPARRRPTE